MRDRLTALGWSHRDGRPRPRSLGGRRRTRAGFDPICLREVGARRGKYRTFARNSRDWQQLIAMCCVVDTMLVDQETVYAPRQGNDRLLLGLKGSLNEYELDLLRRRSLSARYEKLRENPARPAHCHGPGRLREGRRQAWEGSRSPCPGSPSFSSSTRWPNSAAPGGPCSGSSSMGWICQPGATTVTWSGVGQIMRPSTG
ncbi:putative DNA recombinase [Mesorhizobium plurifarium]|uniref:Putative DNA recombinase n=1 Tax=Mesorhizobium plurifarium TaxID=69974 RepID=A0A090DEC4_MESPL|nr:putative DNA recombinase [Mesorhizobium plurifarium]